MLDLTIDQIQFVSHSIVSHKVWQLNLVLEPISQALDSGFNKGKVKGKKNQRRQTPSKAQSEKTMTPEQQDARLSLQLQMMGMPIHDPK